MLLPWVLWRLMPSIWMSCSTWHDWMLLRSNLPLMVSLDCHINGQYSICHAYFVSSTSGLLLSLDRSALVKPDSAYHMDLTCVQQQLYHVVSKISSFVALNLGDASPVSKVRTNKTDLIYNGDGPRYKPTLDFTSHFSPEHSHYLVLMHTLHIKKCKNIQVLPTLLHAKLFNALTTIRLNWWVIHDVYNHHNCM